MKIRIRHQSSTIVLNFETENSSGLTFGDLRNKILAETQICRDFQLSLNKKDIIPADDGTHISNFGIVSGDLLFIIAPQQDAVTPAGSSVSMDSVHGSSRDSISKAQYQEQAAASNSNDECMYRNNPDDTMGEGTHAKTAENTVIEGTSRDMTDDKTEESATIYTDDAMGEGSSRDPSDNLMGECLSQGTLDDETGLDAGVAVYDAVVIRCLSEPLLCSESTLTAVPAALEHLFAVAACKSKYDALWIAVHAMMLESGYQLVQDVKWEPVDHLALPVNWQNQGFYRFPYTHSHTEDLVCSVTGVPMGSSLVIHGLVEGSSKFHTRQLQVKTSEFVTDNLTGALQCYRSLDKLSRYVKDSICLPLVNAVRSELGLPDCEGLLAMTHELQLKIFTYLDAWSALKVDQTCRQCHVVARDPYLWRRLYLQDFGRTDNLRLSRPWYELYKVEHKKKMEKRKALSQMMLVAPNLLWRQHAHPPEFPPFYPHGIIGGDYDLHPQFHGIPNPFLIRPGQAGPVLPRPRFNPFGPNDEDYNLPENRRMGRFPNSGVGRLGGFGPSFGPRFL